MAQRPPQRVDAPNSGTGNAATFIFLHGFGDDSDGWINIAQQFHSANKLLRLSWIFPNAPHNHDVMTTAWYTPTSFSPIPVGRSAASSVQKEKDDEDEELEEEEGEEEILKSVEYICGLIDEEVEKGVRVERIVVGGFSQGCAVSLVTALAGRYKGRIGGVVGMSGYLPRGKKIKEGRKGFTDVVKERDGQKMKVFLAHGTKDMMVPMRVFRDAKARVTHTVGEDVMEIHEYEGLGHVASGAEFRDMCTFLERIIPE